MMNLREEVEKILAQVLMKHHDDISKQDEDAIAEASEQILQVLGEMLPKEEKADWQGDNYDSAYTNGFNSCLAQIRERIGER